VIINKFFSALLAAGIFALAACSSNSSNEETTSSSSSDGTAASLSSSSGDTQANELYCYNADGREDCDLIGGPRGCWESQEECVLETGTVESEAWCKENNKLLWPCPEDEEEKVIGSCIMYEGVVCYEGVQKYICEDVYGEAFSPNACDTSIYSYCYEEEEDCVKITSSFSKDDCSSIGSGMLVTPEACLIEPLSGN
jgi:hypothetical protein